MAFLLFAIRLETSVAKESRKVPAFFSCKCVGLFAGSIKQI